MGVLKNKRNESKFEVFHHAYDMRRDIELLMIKHFGYKCGKVFPFDSDKTAKSEDALKQEQEHLIEEFEMNIARIKQSEVYIRDNLMQLCGNIHGANTIFVTTMPEYEERRLLQDRAIVNCSNIVQEIQYIVESLNLDVNKFFSIIESLDEEIRLIKGWRKSDSRIKKEIK